MDSDAVEFLLGFALLGVVRQLGSHRSTEEHLLALEHQGFHAEGFESRVPQQQHRFVVLAAGQVLNRCSVVHLANHRTTITNKHSTNMMKLILFTPCIMRKLTSASGSR
jgi:hypothetical protein